MTVEETYLTQLRQGIGCKQPRGGEAEGLKVERLNAIQGTTALTTEDKRVLARAMMRQQQQLLTLVKVWEALEKEGVRPVLLKGLGLARLYPEPYRRTSSDVDLWVGKGHYDKVTEVIERELDVEWHHESETENERHYNFNTKQGLVFEIHPQTILFTLPKEKAALEAIELPAMEQAEEFAFEGYRFRMPEASFNLLFVFMHAWEHFISSGAGMKHLADLAILVGEKPTSGSSLKGREEWLVSALVALNLKEPWEVTGYVVVKAFGLNKEQWPGYKDTRRTRRLGERLYRRIMEEGLTRKPEELGVHGKWIGKVVTLCSRIRTAMMIAPYSPQYARHFLYCAVYKGLKRLGVAAFGLE